MLHFGQWKAIIVRVPGARAKENAGNSRATDRGVQDRQGVGLRWDRQTGLAPGRKTMQRGASWRPHQCNKKGHEHVQPKLDMRMTSLLSRCRELLGFATRGEHFTAGRGRSQERSWTEEQAWAQWIVTQKSREFRASEWGGSGRDKCWANQGPQPV